MCWRTLGLCGADFHERLAFLGRREQRWDQARGSVPWRSSKVLAKLRGSSHQEISFWIAVTKLYLHFSFQCLCFRKGVPNTWSLGSASLNLSHTDGVKVTFYFILVSMYACVHMRMCRHLLTEGRGLPWMSFLGYHPPFSLRQDLFLGPGTYNVNYACCLLNPKEPPFSAASVLGLETTTPGFLFIYFTWVLGIKLRSLCLQGKHFINGTISQALIQRFKCWAHNSL